ncbi:hypothetical protein GYMLUDRAFT_914912 [Collybiopsis luxurians FD-317 M1]|nr:hypothetical protein GYMLUDRAFT_914912 [Collybiopsis luxurians FD-317 M1]
MAIIWLGQAEVREGVELRKEVGVGKGVGVSVEPGKVELGKSAVTGQGSEWEKVMRFGMGAGLTWFGGESVDDEERGWGCKHTLLPINSGSDPDPVDDDGGDDEDADDDTDHPRAN